MSIHADLTRYVEETFFPALPEPQREVARLLHVQMRKLDTLHGQMAEWFTPEQTAARTECEKVLAEVAIEVREAYKLVLKMAEA